MGTLDIVELQRMGEAIEHVIGDAARVPALETGVVLDRDAGKQGDLVAAKPRDASSRAEPGKARLLRADLAAPRHQELADLAADVVPAAHIG